MNAFIIHKDVMERVATTEEQGGAVQGKSESGKLRGARRGKQGKQGICSLSTKMQCRE